MPRLYAGRALRWITRLAADATYELLGSAPFGNHGECLCVSGEGEIFPINVVRFFFRLFRTLLGPCVHRVDRRAAAVADKEPECYAGFSRVRDISGTGRQIREWIRLALPAICTVLAVGSPRAWARYALLRTSVAASCRRVAGGVCQTFAGCSNCSP